MDGDISTASSLSQASYDKQSSKQGFVSDLLVAAASLSDGNSPVSISIGGQETNNALEGLREQGMMETLKPSISLAAEARSSRGDENEASRETHEEEMSVDEVKEGQEEEAGVPGKISQDAASGQDMLPAGMRADGSAKDVAVSGGDRQAVVLGPAEALEAILDDLMTVPGEANSLSEKQHSNQHEENAREAEWEVDSSPYESSSDSDSSDSSDSSDIEEPQLGAEEHAKLLMAGDFDDGEELGAKGAKGGSPGHYRSKNELPEEVIPKPAITITDNMNIEFLGSVSSIVENTVVIQSDYSGEVKALNTGSVLCLENRTVIGALAETLGNVRRPLYTVCFEREEDIHNLGVDIGVKIFYSTDHTKIVWMKDIRDLKGSDASNLHDEEIDQDEMEFSDDEKEAEHRKTIKMKKRSGKAGRGGLDQISQPHPLRNAQSADDTLHYDDDEDGPYKPLTRPSSFGQGASLPLPPSLPPKPEVTGFSRAPSGNSHRGSRGGRGDFRGRGNRHHPRGDRRPGRGRGGYMQAHEGHGHNNAITAPYPPTSFSTSAPQMQQPQHSRNPTITPQPYGSQRLPVVSASWAAGSSPPPVSYMPAVQPSAPYAPPPPVQGSRPPASPAPPAGSFNFSQQLWQQALPQQYHYSQAAPHPSRPQQSPAAGYASTPAPPTWPSGSLTGSHPNQGFTGQQGYWGEQ